MDWITFTLSIVGSVFAGAAASIFAPWAKWGIEKRRNRMAYRQKLVESWYEIIDDYQNIDLDIIDHKSYKTLRQHLTSEAITEFEIARIGAPIVIEVGYRGVTADRKLRVLLSEIKRIEAKWKLV